MYAALVRGSGQIGLPPKPFSENMRRFGSDSIQTSLAALNAPNPGGDFGVASGLFQDFQESFAMARQFFVGRRTMWIEFNGLLMAAHGVLKGITAIVQTFANDSASQTPQSGRLWKCNDSFVSECQRRG